MSCSNLYPNNKQIAEKDISIQLGEVSNMEIDYINSYIKDFDENISEDDYKDSRFSYRLLFIPKSANRKGQADRVIEFIPSDSELAKGINKEYCTFKEKEKIK